MTRAANSILALFGLFVVAALSACTSISVDARRQDAFSIAQKAGFQPFKIHLEQFDLFGFSKKETDPGDPIVYIEGDGFAWIDRYTISSNPTPRNPLALKLAVKETSFPVFYLARPCQYVDLKSQPNCKNAYWTNARFAPEVVESFNQALTFIKKKVENDGFHLVGFSGGGAIATLLAAKRTDIKSIRTVAGNLDHTSLNAYRKVSPLTGSLNPMDIARDIRHIPQVHFSGGKDKVIPQWVAANFAGAAKDSACIRTQVVSGAEHMDGWEKAWSALHKQIPKC